MGVTMSEPVVDKMIDSKQNDRFYVGSCAMQGWRLTMEDSHTVLMELPGDSSAAFFAVFDGHGGSKVSDLASRNLHLHLLNNPNYKAKKYDIALREAFLSFDAEVRDSSSAGLAGTTAVCYLIVDNSIYCANIGDSRGVACVQGNCIPLSEDHKPDNELEHERIVSAGGYVQASRVNGNLALSRAFGDFQYKENLSLPVELQVVSPMPDVKKIELNENVEFLVLACDGIWDVLTSEEVIEFVTIRLLDGMRPDIICEQITTRCLATDYELAIGCDNMTIVLICYTRGLTYSEFCKNVQKNYSAKSSQIVIKNDDEEEEEEEEEKGEGEENEEGQNIELQSANHEQQPTTCTTNQQQNQNLELNQENAIISNNSSNDEKNLKLMYSIIDKMSKFDNDEDDDDDYNNDDHQNNSYYKDCKNRTTDTNSVLNSNNSNFNDSKVEIETEIENIKETKVPNSSSKNADDDNNQKCNNKNEPSFGEISLLS